MEQEVAGTGSGRNRKWADLCSAGGRKCHERPARRTAELKAARELPRATWCGAARGVAMEWV